MCLSKGVLLFAEQSWVKLKPWKYFFASFALWFAFLQPVLIVTCTAAANCMIRHIISLLFWLRCLPTVVRLKREEEENSVFFFLFPSFLPFCFSHGLMISNCLKSNLVMQSLNPKRTRLEVLFFFFLFFFVKYPVWFMQCGLQWHWETISYFISGNTNGSERHSCLQVMGSACSQGLHNICPTLDNGNVSSHILLSRWTCYPTDTEVQYSLLFSSVCDLYLFLREISCS